MSASTIRYGDTENKNTGGRKLWDFVNDCPKGELDEEDRKRLSGNPGIFGSRENIISENR